MTSWTHLPNRRSALVILCLAGSLPQMALASKPDPAVAKFRAAQKAYNMGRFQDALQGYMQAYERKPLPGFLFNIAQCHRQLGEHEQAAFFYRRYLALSPRPVKNQALVQELMREMEEKQREGERKQRETAELKKAELERKREEDARAKAERASLEAPPPRVMEPAPKLVPEPVAAPMAVTQSVSPAREPSTPVYQKWWFWTGVGAAVAAGTVTAFAMQPKAPTPGTLPTIDARSP
jgi:hypothetical protein